MDILGNADEYERSCFIQMKLLSQNPRYEKDRPKRDPAQDHLLLLLENYALPTKFSQLVHEEIMGLGSGMQKEVKKEVLLIRCIFLAAKKQGYVYDPVLLSRFVYGRKEKTREQEKNIKESYDVQIPGQPVNEIYAPRDFFKLFLYFMTKHHTRLRDPPPGCTLDPEDGMLLMSAKHYNKQKYQVMWTLPEDLLDMTRVYLGKDKDDVVIVNPDQSQDPEGVYYITIDYTKYIDHIIAFDTIVRRLDDAEIILDQKYPYTIAAGTIYAFFEFHGIFIDTSPASLLNAIERSEASMKEVLKLFYKILSSPQGMELVNHPSPCVAELNN